MAKGRDTSFAVGILFGVAMTVLAYFGFIHNRVVVAKPVDPYADPSYATIRVPVVGGLTDWEYTNMHGMGGDTVAEVKESLGIDLAAARKRVDSHLIEEFFPFPRKLYDESFSHCERLMAFQVHGPTKGTLVIGFLYGHAHAITFFLADGESWGFQPMGEPLIPPAGNGNEDE
jgi:hypothetical protein